MADEKSPEKDLSIEEIGTDDLEDVAGGVPCAVDCASFPPAKPPIKNN